MSAIVTPWGKRISAPDGRVGLSSSPLNRKLVFAWNGHDGIPYVRAPRPTITNVKQSASNYGRSWAFQGGAEGASDINFGAYAETANLHQSPATWAFLWTVGSTFGDCALACQTDANNDRGWSIGRHYDGTQFGIGIWCVRATTNVRRVATDTIANYSTHSLVITYDGSNNSSGINIYLDGKLGTMATGVNGTGTTGAATSESLYLGRRRYDTTQSANHQLALALIGQRTWSAQEAWSFHQRPFQVFTGQKNPVFSWIGQDVGGGGSQTAGAVTPTADVVATSAALKAAAGASDGTVGVVATGAKLVATSGTVDGTANVAGVALASRAVAGTVDGTVSVVGATGIALPRAGASDPAADAQAVSAALKAGSSAVTASADAAGAGAALRASLGAATPAADAAAVASKLAAAVGAADASAAVAGVGQAAAATLGAVDAQASVSGVSAVLRATVGASTPSADVASVGSGAAVGTIDAAASALGATAKLAAAIGAATPTADVSASTTRLVAVTGTVDASASASGVTAAGSSQGTVDAAASVSGVSAVLRASAGTATPQATVDGIASQEAAGSVGAVTASADVQGASAVLRAGVGQVDALATVAGVAINPSGGPTSIGSTCAEVATPKTTTCLAVSAPTSRVTSEAELSEAA